MNINQFNLVRKYLEIMNESKKKWTYDAVKQEASKYKTKIEFVKGCNSAYNVARKNGWLDEYDWFENGLKLLGDQKRKWTHETCKEEAQKFNSRKEFQKGNSSAYQVARINGWLDEWFGEPLVRNNYWNYETCKEEASKYSSRSEFSKGCGSAYQVASKNGWIDEWFGHLRKSWDYDSVKEEASKYKSRKEFENGCGSAYKIASKNGWLDEWFNRQNKSWDYDSVKEEASKYNSRAEFAKSCPSAYNVARKNGWLDEWFGHLLKSWNYDSVKAEASKYSSKSEFKKECCSAYDSACRYGWLDDFTWLKDERFDLYKDPIDCVYVYEFPELNSAYIGRTLIKRQNKRNKEHLINDKDAVYIFAKQNDIPIPKMKILETDLKLEEGKERERYWEQWYREQGWNTLNRTKTGSIGALGKGKWNKKEKVQAEASKYKSRKEFEKGSRGAYGAARRNGWLDEFFGEYKTPKGNSLKSQNFWNNYEHCKKEASKYMTRTEFAIKNDWAYKVSSKNGWLDDFYGKKKSWDYDSVKEEASKYSSRAEFVKGCNSAYSVARKNGWLDEWFGHQHKSWDYDSVKEEASKYSSRSEFHKGCISAYQVARKNGWLDEFFSNS